MLFPQLAMFKVIKGSVTVTVDAGTTVEHVIDLKKNYAIVGVPEVSTSTPDAEVKVVNGGINKFTVEITNSGTSSADVEVKYTVLVAQGS